MQVFELVYSHSVSKVAQELLQGDVEAVILQKIGNLKDLDQVLYESVTHNRHAGRFSDDSLVTLSLSSKHKKDVKVEMKVVRDLLIVTLSKVLSLLFPIISGT